jgi:hypothetical protein
MDPLAGNSAGTVVAAVLENAGYYSQQQILEFFEPLWSGWGVLLFVASAILGLSRFVLTGQLAGVRLLLVGPFVFLFIVGTTTEIPLVRQKLGDKSPRPVENVHLTKINAVPEANTVRISLLFSIFTRVTSSVVSTFQGFILENAEDEEFLFTNRTKALQSLMTMDPASPEFFGMLDGPLLDQCATYLSAIINLSSNDYSTEYTRRLEELAAAGDATATRTKQFLERQWEYWESVRLQGEERLIRPNNSMRSFIARQTNIFANGGPGINYAAQFGIKHRQDPARFVEEELPDLAISCTAATQIVADAAVDQADWLERFVLDSVQDSQMNGEADKRARLCEAISLKINANHNRWEECELGPTVSLFVLKRLFSHGSLTQALERSISRTTLFIANNANGCDPSEKDDSSERYCRGVQVDQPNAAFQEIGDEHAERAKGIIQSVMSLGYDLPYFQGLLLYIIATFFPFAAVFVLVPGRVGAFLTLPLLWLWVKSWDVGFAFVMLLDKILYNLVPPLEINANGRPAIGDLPDLLRQAAGHDLNGDILAHYHFIGFCLSSVPAIMGMLVTRAASSMSVFMNEMANRSTFFRLEQSSGTDPITRALEAKRQQEQPPPPRQPSPPAVEQNKPDSNSSRQQTPRLPDQTSPPPN